MEWFQTASLISAAGILSGGGTVLWLDRNPITYGTCGYGASNVAAVLAVVAYVGGFVGVAVSLIGWIASWQGG